LSCWSINLTLLFNRVNADREFTAHRLALHLLLRAPAPQCMCFRRSDPRLRMSPPVIVLISTDPAIAAEVTEKMADRVEWQVCRTLKEALDTLDQQRAWGFLYDLRQMIGGGHAEERFLELVAER